jgi:hypothetical protein
MQGFPAIAGTIFGIVIDQQSRDPGIVDEDCRLFLNLPLRVRSRIRSIFQRKSVRGTAPANAGLPFATFKNGTSIGTCSR